VRGLRIGLTGGIASGKTTVSEYFSALGVPVVDADEISRQLTAQGQPLLEKIARCFGTKVIFGGVLDRRLLRKLIFANPQQRRLLEGILHPEIMAEMQRQSTALFAHGQPYCILSIPLLVEKALFPFVDRILVVDCEEETQKSRLIARDGMVGEVEVSGILAAQCGRCERLAKADDVIYNDGMLDFVKQRVLELHHNYLQIARKIYDLAPNSCPL